MEMQSKKMSGVKKGVSAQQFLDIAEIRDDAVILKDHSLRAILAVSSVNFALKSEPEQNALISGYAQFLNSLDHPLQIVIQSRHLNIEEYIKRLEGSEKEQTNELLRLQITDYLSFIKELVELGAIMSKRFYVVIPYSPISDRRKSFWNRLLEVANPLRAVRLKETHFMQYKETLAQRMGHVQSGLASLGLKTQALDTEALMELFYRVYNPDLADVQKLQEVAKIRLEEANLA